MHVEHYIHDATAIREDGVATCGVDVVPVHLVAHAVEATLCACGNGKLGHTLTDTITIATCGAVALVPGAVNLEGIVAHYIAALGRCTIVVEGVLEESIAAPVDIYIAAHPTTGVVEGRLHLASSLG